MDADFRALYDRFFPLVWRWAARLGIPRDALEDAVQEIFFTVYSQLDAFEGRSSLKTWVFGVTVGVTRNYRRKRSIAHLSDGSEMDALADGLPHPEAQAEQSETLARLQQILNGLDVDKREVFVLAELEQLSMNEISSVLGISSNTVASRLRVAREEVRAAWERARTRDQWRVR